MSFLLFFISFFIVAGAQPDWSPLLCILASSLGYALFWYAIKKIESEKKRFWLSLFWFATIQAIQLNWLLADRYMGPLIYPFSILLFSVLGLQFAALSYFVLSTKTYTIHSLLGLSGGWFLLEWSRLYFFSGFSWNPVGLALTGTHYGMQGVALFGVLGLSFFLVFTNLLALKMFQKFSKKTIFVWMGVVSLPYLWGGVHTTWHTKKSQESNSSAFSVVLVQTALAPEQKIFLSSTQKELPLSPVAQWERIIQLIYPYQGQPIDFIVLSEGAVPYGTAPPIYDGGATSRFFHTLFGIGQESASRVGNQFWIQNIADAFHANVIIGLEDTDQEGGEIKHYNAGFLFRPFDSHTERYEKRILLPIAEYFPFHWCEQIAARFEIAGCFTPGKEAKVFHTEKGGVALSICYEETYGNLMRENKKKGAHLLVNISNDVWYPYSRLPMVHFLHGRLRAVENGLPLVRSCNTGVTCGVDSLGKTVEMVDYERRGHASCATALHVQVPSYQYSTLYTQVGDSPLIYGSLICFGWMFYRRRVLSCKK